MLNVPPCDIVAILKMGLLRGSGVLLVIQLWGIMTHGKLRAIFCTQRFRLVS